MKTRLETLRRKNQDGEYKAVIIAKKLSAISKEIDDSADRGATEIARGNIERYCEELERDVLDQFNEAFAAYDLEKMERCARTLYDFNGGNSCLQSYINQNEFFINTGWFQII
jgi:hypothetical protein